MLTFSHDVRPAYQHAWKGLVNSASQTQYTQDDKAYYLTFNLPGFRPEDVSVSVEKGVLSLAVLESSSVDNSNLDVDGKEGEQSSAREPLPLWEKRYKLPEDVDSSDISAELKLGQLFLTLNKVPQAKAVKVHVKG